MKTRGRLLGHAVLAVALPLSQVPVSQPVRAVSATLVINEIDYDQANTDTAEFLELKNVGPIDLDPYTVELVNGTGGGAAV